MRIGLTVKIIVWGITSNVISHSTVLTHGQTLIVVCGISIKLDVNLKVMVIILIFVSMILILENVLNSIVVKIKQIMILAIHSDPVFLMNNVELKVG